MSRMWKKQGCVRMESLLHHDVVERILERVPVKSLLRFKIVSKEWKSTIESRLFQEKQYRNRKESGDPDVLMVSVLKYEDGSDEPDIESSLRTLVLGSSSSVKIPTCWEDSYYFVCPSSFDGLVCLYFPLVPVLVVNPTTRWHRPLPFSKYQQHIIDLGEETYLERGYELFRLGFGKDKFTGICKPVWLYNSCHVGLENQNQTSCEVFDFSTNAWRYVTPASPYPIIGQSAYVDGSLYWFTDCVETKIVSFDLHTEAFQVLSKPPPFAIAKPPNEIVICNLDNRLCVSEMTWPNQVIWSFHSGNKTWDKIYSIDLVQTLSMFDLPKHCALMPVAVLDGDKKNKKKKLLFYGRQSGRTLVIHDPQTQSYDAALAADSVGYAVCYFQSLISI